MKVYLVHYLIEEDVYYNDVIFNTIEQAIAYLLQTYTESQTQYINEVSLDKNYFDIGIAKFFTDIDYFKKCVESYKNQGCFIPMYRDIPVKIKIPHFGYIQEFEIDLDD